MVKYGVFVSGLIGAVSVVVVPLAMTPSFSSTTLKLVEELNTSAHFASIAPRLAISGG
ncbi:hypothetical protein ACG3QZ_00360 [Pseudomonas aeruginosa]|uniref:hypothetical protein n=1 Tax=Pseudomonas aeruginosa TaxID=287 RepID=UPI002679862C